MKPPPFQMDKNISISKMKYSEGFYILTALYIKKLNVNILSKFFIVRNFTSAPSLISEIKSLIKEEVYQNSIVCYSILFLHIKLF